MSPKEEAYKEVENLVNRFEEQLPSYKKSDYNETLVRRDFIDPFFKALGWDVDNSQGYAEAYREVIHEDRLKVSGANKAPDYSFRLPGGKRLFFVEAKKPSVYIKEDVLPAYQVRRYGWSAKLAVSIVTDFEEFALYDCIKKPSQTDKASTARIKYFTYKEYLNQFDFLWDTFSKEKVLRGGLDKFVTSKAIKRGTATVDKEFLNSLDEWRKELALNIALRNEVNNDELNFVVQALLDRLIFLRIAEDRAIEPYGSLRNCTLSIGGEKNIVYTRLLKLFTEADSKYNSGIFNFKQDGISKRLEIDNATLRRIIQQLYYPESPYEFSVINVEILGSAYEQFLGKQITLKGTHKATIEEKPEVRKAGGVYYTPQYIVDYIVDNTVGKKLKELEQKKATSPKPSRIVGTDSPKERALEALKIVDPACGSGSFLLGAYDKLLKWHHAYYLPEFERLSAIAGSNNYILKQRNDAIRERNKLPFTPEGRLTTTIKKQILLNNIYGVDIDANAVEVTKLSLLLKCLEDETQSSINAELRFGETVLPSLENNIRVGNSLIDIDFYEGVNVNAEKVKPFNWYKAFPEVFKIQKPTLNKELKYQFQKIKNQEEETDRLIDKLSNQVEESEASYSKNRGFDIVIGNPPYVLLQSLETREVFDYTLNKYQSAKYKIDTYQLFIEVSLKLLKPDGLLGFITPNTFLKNIHAEPLRRLLLENSTIQELVLFNYSVFTSASVDTCILITQRTQAKETSAITIKTVDIPFEPYTSGLIKQSSFKKNNRKDFNTAVSDNDTEVLNTIVSASIALSHYCSAYFGIQTFDRTKYVATYKKNKHYMPVIDGANIAVYQLKPGNEFVHFIPEAIKSGGNESVYLKERICIRQIGVSPIATIIPSGIFALNTVYNIFLKEEGSIELKFLLGIINSNLIKYYWRKTNADEKKTFPKIKKEAILSIPVKLIKTENDKRLKQDIVKLVDTMLQLNQKLQQTTLPQQQEQLKQRIAFTDKKIDALVYELYGLSEEEIKIVEGN